MSTDDLIIRILEQYGQLREDAEVLCDDDIIGIELLGDGSQCEVDDITAQEDKLIEQILMVISL